MKDGERSEVEKACTGICLGVVETARIKDDEIKRLLHASY